MLRSKFVKFLMSILKQQIDSSPNFLSLFSFMKDNSSVLFWFKQYILCSKGTHKNENFWDFKCSGQNSSNFSCQLSNGKSIPLQILRNSSLSRQITPLWIWSSYFFKFGLKDPIKIPILSALEKNCHFLMSFSKPQVSWN